MSLMIDDLINKILQLSNKEKEEAGNQIVKMLGGDCTKLASDLPKRRGNTDGGIDGRIDIIIPTKTTCSKIKLNEQHIITSIDSTTAVKTAFNIKLENKPFSRTYFGGFLNDMGREKIYTGIIVTACGLAKDVESEINRYNNDALSPYEIYHIHLRDLFNNQLELNIKLASGQNFSDCIYSYLCNCINI